LVVLAVLLLLLLRKLPLVLLLVLTLMLMLVLVTLLAEVGCLSSRDDCYSRPEIHRFCVPVLHLVALPFSHDCSIDQMLEGGECVIHQLVVMGVNHTSQKIVLPLSIRVDIFWCVT
jgi:hypothetical protein